MKIAVFGATGSLGKQIVVKAIEQGISVKVLVRNEAKLGELASHLEVVTGDYFDSRAQAETLKGVDAVVSTIGPPPIRKGSPSAQKYGDAMVSLVKSMDMQGINRIVNVAGASASFDGESISLLRKIMRLMMSWMVPEITPAKELEIGVLRKSSINYTTVRPPVIADKVEGSLKLSDSKTQGMKVDVSQLAEFMLASIGNSDWHRRLPFVATS
ncbi:NAD(P)H-binding protein [Vibrio tubiashii]|uniref:NAD(P)H-binding protein n=1 Tax=Vibrio tubiashii TaxID=29498 RepID=A0AAE5GPT2_9VIBR|nr:NAD(P)H-binding protein [Vibrio tubiashii]NOI80741.1 NAD(P)H-binding protein [Vibrio tubiashii]